MIHEMLNRLIGMGEGNGGRMVESVLRHWLNDLWAPMIFLGPMPWLMVPHAEVPIWLKVVAVISMIIGLAMIRPLKLWYVAFVFVCFWMMGVASWLAILRPHLLFAAMLLALYLDDWAEKNRRSRDV